VGRGNAICGTECGMRPMWPTKRAVCLVGAGTPAGFEPAQGGTPPGPIHASTEAPLSRPNRINSRYTVDSACTYRWRHSADYSPVSGGQAVAEAANGRVCIPRLISTDPHFIVECVDLTCRAEDRQV
jgi:hypothetical protein